MEHIGVLVHKNLTQWAIENGLGKGSRGEGEDQLPGVEQTIWSRDEEQTI